MKKKVLCVIMILSFILGGCGNSKNYKRHAKEMQEEMINTIAEATENGDVDALYQLFTPIIQAENPNLKAEINDFIELYKGEKVSVKRAYYNERETSNDKKGWKIRVSIAYVVTTSEDEYDIQLIWYPEVYDENYKGIISLGIQREEEFSTDSPMAPDIRGAYAITPENREEINKRVDMAVETSATNE